MGWPSSRARQRTDLPAEDTLIDMKPLHIAASLKIVAKHKHMPGIPLEQARDVIRGLVMPGGRVTQDDERLVEDLERVTGMPIAELARLTVEWVPKG
jgi:hypothetical protein